MIFDVQAARELVERKRRTHQCAFTANTLQEACDEIERLRAELRRDWADQERENHLRGTMAGGPESDWSRVIGGRE